MAKVTEKHKNTQVTSQFAHNLSAQKREVFGRKVKRLRREGILPANVSGKHIKSFSVQVKADEFNKVFENAGETGVVGLEVAGEVHPILIHEVYRDPVYGRPLHADLLEVNLAEKVVATVPLEIVGESPVVQAEEGVLVQQMHEVEVEALPTNLPEKIEVDISGLMAVDDAVKIGDIKVDRSTVEIKEEDPERIVVSIAAPTKEEIVEEVAQVTEGEDVGTEEEGKTPAEDGEEKASEEPSEKSKE